jgi:hypothetical protein
MKSTAMLGRCGTWRCAAHGGGVPSGHCWARAGRMASANRSGRTTRRMAANMQAGLRSHKRDAGRIPKDPPRVSRAVPGDKFRISYDPCGWRRLPFRPHGPRRTSPSVPLLNRRVNTSASIGYAELTHASRCSSRNLTDTSKSRLFRPTRRTNSTLRASPFSDWPMYSGAASTSATNCRQNAAHSRRRARMCRMRSGSMRTSRWTPKTRPGRTSLRGTRPATELSSRYTAEGGGVDTGGPNRIVACRHLSYARERGGHLRLPAHSLPRS